MKWLFSLLKQKAMQMLCSYSNWYANVGMRWIPILEVIGIVVLLLTVKDCNHIQHQIKPIEQNVKIAQNRVAILEQEVRPQKAKIGKLKVFLKNKNKGLCDIEVKKNIDSLLAHSDTSQAIKQLKIAVEKIPVYEQIICLQDSVISKQDSIIFDSNAVSFNQQKNIKKYRRKLVLKTIIEYSLGALISYTIYIKIK